MLLREERSLCTKGRRMVRERLGRGEEERTERLPKNARFGYGAAGEVGRVFNAFGLGSYFNWSREKDRRLTSVGYLNGSFWRGETQKSETLIWVVCSESHSNTLRSSMKRDDTESSRAVVYKMKRKFELVKLATRQDLKLYFVETEPSMQLQYFLADFRAFS